MDSADIQLDAVDAFLPRAFYSTTQREYACDGSQVRTLYQAERHGKPLGKPSGVVFSSKQFLAGSDVARADLRYWLGWWGVPLTDILEGKLADFESYYGEGMTRWGLRALKWWDQRHVNFVMDSLRSVEQVGPDEEPRQHVLVVSDQAHRFDFCLNPARGWLMEDYRRWDARDQLVGRYEVELVQTSDGTWYPRRIARVSGAYLDVLELAFFDDVDFSSSVPAERFALSFPPDAQVEIITPREHSQSLDSLMPLVSSESAWLLGCLGE